MSDRQQAISDAGAAPMPQVPNALSTIEQLVKDGVLGPEQCPEPDYWSWPVRDASRLPEWLLMQYSTYGEIRWFW